MYVPKPLAVPTTLVLRPSAADLGEMCLGMHFRVAACRYQRKIVVILQVRTNVWL